MNKSLRAGGSSFSFGMILFLLSRGEIEWMLNWGAFFIILGIAIIVFSILWEQT